MTKRFKITIIEVGQEKRPTGGTWEKGAGEDGDSYGYTPEIQVTREYEREVYQQAVDDLDLKAVINAVNP